MARRDESASRDSRRRFARAVARAGAVGDAPVEGHADETDVDFIEPHSVGEAEEGRDSAVARMQLRIGQFRIALNLLDHAQAHRLGHSTVLHTTIQSSIGPIPCILKRNLTY